MRTGVMPGLVTGAGVDGVAGTDGVVEAVDTDVVSFFPVKALVSKPELEAVLIISLSLSDTGPV